MIFHPPPRGIHSSNPRKCSVYISQLYTQLEHHNIFYRIKKLHTWTDRYGLTDRLQNKWEALDRDITASCLSAERQTGSQDCAPWSPKLHQGHLHLLYWRIVVRALKNSTDPTDHLTSILPQLRSTPIPTADLQEALTQLRIASQQLRKIRVAAADYRQTHLENRAQLAATTHNCIVESIIKRIIQAENTRSAYNI